MNGSRASVGSATGVLLLVLSLFCIGCDPSSSFADGFEFSEDYRHEEFRQNQPRATDVLWVIDTSCSMVDEQEVLAENFGSFLEYFVMQDVPFRMGVTSTNLDEAESDGLDGELYGSPRWLDWSDTDIEEKFMERVTLGIDPEHGRERGLHASYVALTDRLEGPNAGFLRPEASLVVLVVSDEPDYSTLGEEDSDDFIGAEDYAEWLGELKGEGQAQLSAIVGVDPAGLDGPEGCVHGNFQGQPNLDHGALRGDGYIEAAMLSGGSVQSICTEDWTSALYRLGTTSSGLREGFTLSEAPDLMSLRVRVGGDLSSAWVYDGVLQAIVFDPMSIPAPGVRVSVSYLPLLEEGA